MTDRSIYHHGIKGMKWGIRRFQNKDGTLTPEGKKRAAKSEKKRKTPEDDKSKTKSSAESSVSNKSKKLEDMSDAELRAVVNRLQLEQQYKKLNPKKVSLGEKFVSKVGKEVIVPAVIEVSRNNFRDQLDKEVKKYLSKAS